MAPSPEVLGEVVFASGTALVVDTGLLNLWCHDRPPRLPEGVLSTPAATASANRSQDFRIDGPDAEAAGRLFDRQWHPRYLFDAPGEPPGASQALFAEFAKKNGLDAQLVPLVPRVTHLRRVALAIERGGGAGQLQVQGVPMVAAGGLPPGERLPVIGVRREQEPYAGLWSWVGIQVREGGEVHESVRAGITGVDRARLMFVDPEALGEWQHEEPTDGLADFVFWGRDAEKVRKRLDAPVLGEREFGWVDLPVEEAVRRGESVEEAVSRGEMKLATDFRPHSHHYHLLKQMRSCPSESGTLALGGGRCCAFFTGWGDGLFPVFRDLDSQGRLVRLRVELGTAEAIANLDSVNGG
jgi:hypothetical protein